MAYSICGATKISYRWLWLLEPGFLAGPQWRLILFRRMSMLARSRRGQRVSIFQDEIQMNAGDFTVPPSGVALIKIFPAGTAISARAPGGVIAIYAKRGDPYDLPPSPYTCTVKRYTQPEILWQ
jgi:hypothetical protein